MKICGYDFTPISYFIFTRKRKLALVPESIIYCYRFYK